MLTFKRITATDKPGAVSLANAALYRMAFEALSTLRPLAGTSSVDGIQECLHGFAGALGVLHFAFLVVDRASPNLPALWIADDIAGWWRELIPELHTLLSTSRAAPRASAISHTWFDVGGPARAEGTFAGLREMGVRHGLLVPSEALQPGRIAGCMMLGCADSGSSCEDRQLPALIAHAASLGLDAYLRLPPRLQAKGKLSARESECLRWASLGKTSWETACILGVSERTINFHLGNAFTKLKVNNKQAAVAQAILQDLI